MSARNRSNPLALAVLMCLCERPMHPYEVATTLRQRNKHESVRLNYGSLYAVVESLERRGLIEPKEIERSGRLPERTIYHITDAGKNEVHEWLSELLSVPAKEYPAFEAAISFLPGLPPATVVALLEERATRLELDIAAWWGSRELLQKRAFPRLFWVEGDYANDMKVAELDWVRRLSQDISTGALEGLDWWQAVHEGADGTVPPPPFDLLATEVLHSYSAEEGR
ncbi:MAG TPA: PadR family transcriptional regulator [Acidimicrobiales bacterium]|nr:PadR family transcriptional regulator [Acidimicrobiales bacterium]